MSVYPPPTQNVPIFNPLDYIPEITSLTKDIADGLYLQYPVAQGFEELQDIIVEGTSTINGTESHFNTELHNGVITFNNTETHNATSTYNASIIANNTITQNNTGTNIDQTDHTINTNANNLRATTIFGDLNLKKPTTVNGGAIRLYDVGGTTSNSMQLYQSGAGASIVNLALGGVISMTQKNSTNVDRNIFRGTTTGTTIQQYATDISGIVLKVLEVESQKNISFYPNSTTGAYNPAVSNLDNQIVSGGTALNTSTLVVGCASNVSNGLKVDSVNNITEIGQGGTSNSAFTTGFKCTDTNASIIGPCQFTSTSAPTSLQSPQLAVNDSSNKIPTTAWVQSAISGGSLSPMPYYQAYYFINAPSNFDRYATFQFNFTGTNWGINDFFSISLRCSLITTSTNTTVAPNYATFNTIIDVYPARCPANNTNPSAYGVNPTQPNTTNFSLLNGSIYNGGLQSAYVLTSNGLPYVPYGRWYFSNNYTIWTSGTAYPTTSPSPISPYIQYGTAEKSAFGFGLWGTSFTYSEFSISIQVVNRGPNGTGQGITLSSNYTLGGGNTLNEVKVGL